MQNTETSSFHKFVFSQCHDQLKNIYFCIGLFWYSSNKKIFELNLSDKYTLETRWPRAVAQPIKFLSVALPYIILYCTLQFVIHYILHQACLYWTVGCPTISQVWDIQNYFYSWRFGSMSENTLCASHFHYTKEIQKKYKGKFWNQDIDIFSPKTLFWRYLA